MAWWLHNPLADMYGPDFLRFYAGVMAATLIMAWWWRVRAGNPTALLPPLSLPANPDPYEIAYLRGGENEVMRVVAFGLIQRSYLQVTEEKLWIFSMGQKLTQAPKHPDPRHLSPLEREIFDFFASPSKAADIFQSSSLSAGVRGYCRDYEERLKKDQLLSPPEVRAAARHAGWTGTLVILGLGGYKFAVALAKGRHNVWFLILMAIVSLTILMFVCRPPRLSRRGKDYLKRLQAVFKLLKSRAAVPRSGVPDLTLLLLVSLFGVNVLSGTSYAYFPQLFRQAGASGGGCGGGCGGGGGGGCGGGCGGCGGG